VPCQDSGSYQELRPKELSSRTPGLRLHFTRPTAPNPLPAQGRSGVATCPGEGSLQGKTAGGPGPPTGSRTPTHYPDPSAGRKQAPHPGGVRSRHVSAGGGTRARPRRFPGKARPPTVFNAVNEGALYCRARGDFCQAVLLTARYQSAQCSRWCHPRHTRRSATPARHDSSATEYHNAYAVDQQSTPQPTPPQRAPHRWDR